MYLIGPITAVVVPLLLKKTFLKGPTWSMELLPYKMPSPRVVLHRMVERMVIGSAGRDADLAAVAVVV